MQLLRIVALGCALGCAVGGLAGCSSHIPRFRLDPAGYVYEGYLLGTADGFSVVVEDIRFRPELKGSMIFELCFVNEGHQPAKVDLGLIEVKMSDREVLANEARAILVQPGAVERVTLSFRTDKAAHELERGVLKVGGVALGSGKRFEAVCGFHEATESELAAEDDGA